MAVGTGGGTVVEFVTSMAGALGTGVAGDVGAAGARAVVAGEAPITALDVGSEMFVAAALLDGGPTAPVLGAPSVAVEAAPVCGAT